METVISIGLAIVAVGAGLVFVAAGIFSVIALLFDDLLEPERRPEGPVVHLEEAA